MNFPDVRLIFLMFLSPLISYAQCPASLIIHEQADITSFVTNFPACNRLPGDLLISDTIRDASGNVTDATTDITDLSSLSILEYIGGSVQITGNPLLPNLSGLGNIDSILGDFYLYNNDHANFKTLAGLNSLTHVQNRFTIRLMDNLETFAGMGTLVGPIINEIKITDNPKLASIAAMSGITSTGTDVTIKRNMLPNLQGLNSLTTVGGFFNVQEEVVLVDISQLASLVSVGASVANSDLNISQNPLLSTIDGLEQVTSISGALYLNLNGLLGDCDAVCQLVVAGGAGSLSVGSNKMSTPCAYTMALTDHCAQLLPIDLVDFTSQQYDHEVVLNWETESETNNDGFTIEKSQNGRDWQAIGWVEGQGTTTETQYYRLLDEAPFSGNNYYRLKQIDFDGAYQYSHVISEFIFEDRADVVMIYPNPATHTLYIQHSLAEKLSIAVFDALGRQLIQTMKYDEGIDLSALNFGVYTVQIRRENTIIETQKLVVIK